MSVSEMNQCAVALYPAEFRCLQQLGCKRLLQDQLHDDFPNQGLGLTRARVRRLFADSVLLTIPVITGHRAYGVPTHFHHR